MNVDQTTQNFANNVQILWRKLTKWTDSDLWVFNHDLAFSPIDKNARLAAIDCRHRLIDCSVVGDVWEIFRHVVITVCMCYCDSISVRNELSVLWLFRNQLYIIYLLWYCLYVNMSNVVLAFYTSDILCLLIVC